ncbi:hypothetical protein [Streptomyces sp. NPDC058307]|uniref:hypothetical protein n=1 Tax=Streptomyces sp. NPDC058307 TaxID=3346439 RepID=UPI0036EC0833
MPSCGSARSPRYWLYLPSRTNVAKVALAVRRRSAAGTEQRVYERVYYYLADTVLRRREGVPGYRPPVPETYLKDVRHRYGDPVPLAFNGLSAHTDHAGGVQAERLALEVVGGERHQAFLEDQARGEADGGDGGRHGRQRHWGA